MNRDKTPLENLPVPLGQVDSRSGRIVLDAQRTKPSATAFIQKYYTHSGLRTIHCHQDQLLVWRNNHYEVVEEGEIRKQLLDFLHNAATFRFPPHGGPPALVPFKANSRTVDSVLDALRSVAIIPETVQSPAWLSSSNQRGEAADFIAFKSSLLHVPSGRVILATPLFFNRTALPFNYRARTPTPQRWHRFIKNLFGEDIEAIHLLQEWFGYVLSSDTSQQKALFIVGPKRSGKGTIGRILAALVGSLNVANPTTTGLAGTFGLQPLLGKSLVVVSDARFRGEHSGRLTEVILNITGEDPLTVERKFLGAVTEKLPARLMFLSNELPRLSDASGALASRFLILRLDNSYLGTEDTTLTTTLLKELPGILAWALEGLARLRKRGRFIQPQSSMESAQELEELGSPVSQFVRERCKTGPNFTCHLRDLFAAWEAWCGEEGHEHPGLKSSFGRNLSAAVSGLRVRRDTNQDRFYEGITLK